MALEFDDRWLDVDFRVEAKLADRRLGMTERPPAKFGATLFRDKFTVIPKSEWRGLVEKKNALKTNLRNLVVAICDQNGEPSCTSNSTVQNHQIRQAVQFGKDRVIRLSPISIYRHVGSRNSGSSVDDNLYYLRDNGALPLDCTENASRGIQGLHPHNGYGVKEPSNQVELRRFFRCDEWVLAQTYDEFVSMILMGYAMSYGRQGHCICSTDVDYDSRDNLVHPYANSWSDEWGDEGFGVDSASQIRMGADWAFGCASVSAHPWQLAL